MNGIEIFLVLKENNKDVCYVEYKKIQNISEGLLCTWHEDKSGMSIQGKYEEKEQLLNKLLKYHRRKLEEEN
ncbi:MAG: hypothetical protein RSD47_00765 [Romboutsia sp.]